MSSERSEPAEGSSGDGGKPKKALRRFLRLATKCLGDLTEERPVSLKAPQMKMRPCLDGLTEELTLGILKELDFGSLAAVKRLSRRFCRIAQDPSIFGRVSRVQWTADMNYRHGWQFDEDHRFYFLTDCPQLGRLPMPEEEEAGSAKCQLILAGLLEGGAKASLVSLQTPLYNDGGVVAALPALLTKHQVRLEALSCCSLPHSLYELIRSQPGLSLLLARDFEKEDLRPLMPSLRHLVIAEWLPELGLRGVAKLLPQLRSLVIQSVAVDDFASFFTCSGGLFLWAIGDIHIGPYYACYAALAVNDFRADERGKPFLDEHGRPYDLWDQANHRLPQPTRDPHTARSFFKEVFERKQALSDQ